MNHTPPDLAAIKARLLRAGHPRPSDAPTTPATRQVSREAQEARAALREHVIADLWALIDALEARDQGSGDGLS